MISTMWKMSSKRKTGLYLLIWIMEIEEDPENPLRGHLVQKNFKRKRNGPQKEFLAYWDKVLIVIAAIILLVAGIGGGLVVYREVGGRRLRKDVENNAPNLVQTQETDQSQDMIPEAVEWQDDWISYQGQVYDYNEDILTFLFMGIDKNDETVQKVAEGTEGGQADALFLMVMDSHDQTVDIIGINRNTMTTIDMYDEQGNL